MQQGKIETKDSAVKHVCLNMLMQKRQSVMNGSKKLAVKA